MKTRNPLDPIWRGVLRYTLYFLSVRVAIAAIALVGDGAMQKSQRAAIAATYQLPAGASVPVVDY